VLYPWGDESDPARVINLANFRQGDGRPQDRWVWTNPVRALPPGRAGLYGMGGNAWEWCEDWYFDQAYAAVHPQKPSDPCVRAADVAGLTRKVLRGGSFDGELDLLRCAARGHGTALASASRVGFRCVRNAR
jgi:formylglycine-generating enzyme required for sulfatase activity